MTKGFIFDLDGTVYLGDEIIDGAAEAIGELKKRGDKVVFLTNKSISTRMDYVKKLGALGIPVSIDEVINSNYITAKYLEHHLNPGEKVIVIGEEPLIKELEEQGIPFTSDPKEAKFVVVGWDRQFNYEKLDLAYQAWLNGAKIIATNPDRTCPMPNGQIPDCGGMIGAIEGTTGVKVDYITGKPSSFLATYVLNETIKLPGSQCYMVGDRLETDIRMGNENGINSVLVLTGITTKEMLAETEYKPTHVFDSIKGLVTI
ncbi:HAD-IIA family hydrolase [Fredinandcohnia humi]